MNDLEKYKTILDHFFGAGTARFKTDAEIKNNILGALNHEQFEQFRGAFIERCRRLSALYQEDDPNRVHLVDRLNEMVSNTKWSGVYAEMVALDFLNSNQELLAKPISLSKDIPASETLAGSTGASVTNWDGYYDGFDVGFDVKILGDKTKNILEGVIEDVIKRRGVQDLTIMPEYPPDMDYIEIEKKRPALLNELKNAVIPESGSAFIQSKVVSALGYRLRRGPGVVMTSSRYDPITHGVNHHRLLFKHAKKYSLQLPNMIVFVLFPWFSEQVVNTFTKDEQFFRTFCSQFFFRYSNNNEKASSEIEWIKGDVTLAQVTSALSGVIFIQDSSVTSSNPESMNVTSFAYLNPNATHKVSLQFREYLTGLGCSVEDFQSTDAE